VVVAQGRQLKNMVPLAAFLRRTLHLSAINDAVTQTARTGTGLLRELPDTDRLLRTEPVTMSDGQVHGVHLWTGPTAAEPPERPIPGRRCSRWRFTVSPVTGSARCGTLPTTVAM
jgi:Domain of unknown function (DUF5593)